jgi:predicted PurR-regulated permease PerM
MDKMNNVLAQSQIARFMIIALGVIAIVASMKAIASILNPIFVAVLFAVLFDIPRAWMVKRGVAPGKALLITILGALIITLIFLVFLTGTFINLAGSLPEFEQQIQSQLDELGSMLNQYGINGDQLGDVAQGEQTNPLQVIGYVLGGVVSLLGSALLILIYAVFLLIEASGFSGKLNTAFKPSEPAYRYINDVTTNLRNFLVAQTQVSLATGAGVSVVLWLLGVEFALLWGFVAFLMNYIPYIGSILAAVPAVIVAFI